MEDDEAQAVTGNHSAKTAKMKAKQSSKGQLPSSKKLTGSIALGSMPELGETERNMFSEPPITKLIDLVNSNFEMSPNDKDYRLNHEQMIKVCKILLHKVNIAGMRIDQDRDQTLLQVDDRIKQGYINTRS